MPSGPQGDGMSKTSLFVRNLSFDTTNAQLEEVGLLCHLRPPQ